MKQYQDLRNISADISYTNQMTAMI